MKLRNKKTGEILEVLTHSIAVNVLRDREYITGYYDSLAELNEEWEDYEESKEYYCISDFGAIRECKISKFPEDEEDRKQIGNYFETEEEAEKALEKLNAWKRLKDKGFRFINHIDRDSGQGMTRYEWDGYVNGEDLDLLFGGEE